ncbi:hypothetical protein [Candidatus Rariloculus sp.]|uniref:hypothetical protein n=1 Tax=Candidatus Rariloculus sp. TaxID=3101265 RepID=UPI003D0B4640
MELFRTGRNVYGQGTLDGMSWDLIWVFVAAGAVFILLHAAYRRFLAPKRK